MNSDYVKFARAEGLSEKEIYRIHISRNAVIPIVHGIPANILGCLTGALVTEQVYGVPGVGRLLITALNQVMKLASILLGATVAIGRGGERGFFTGMALAILYMALGYACYVLLGGSGFVASEMLGEILIGAAIGAIAGAVLSNMRPAR